MGDDLLLDGLITIGDGEFIPVSELNFEYGFDLANDADSEGTGITFNRPDIGTITFDCKISRKGLKRLYEHLGLLIYKPSRLRSAIGMKRRKV